jgi:hypothetical protein
VCTIYVERERKNENRYACMLNRKSKERERIRDKRGRDN